MPALPHQNKMSNRSTKTINYKAIVVAFNEGHSQRVSRGPVAARKLDAWVITYEQVSGAMALEILTFLDLIGNWDTFTATMLDGTNIEKTYRIDGPVTHTSIHLENHTISFPIVQELS